MLIVALIFQIAAAPANLERKIEDVFVKADSLSYKGYQVTRSYNPAAEKSWATVKKNGRVIVRHGLGEGLNKIEATRFGLVSLLGGGTKQLIIQQYSGGAHCCNSWWIYDLYPEFRLIYSSDDYSIGDASGESSLVDIDRDGIAELVFSSDWFAYFNRLAFSESPLPKIVFRYNKSTHRYYPANPRYSEYVLKGIEEEINEVKNYSDLLPPVLNVMLQYVYAGKEMQAWAIFDRYYTMSDKEAMKQEIKQRLKADKIYRLINGHRSK